MAAVEPLWGKLTIAGINQNWTPTPYGAC
jgi:hypothetical protein